MTKKAKANKKQDKKPTAAQMELNRSNQLLGFARQSNTAKKQAELLQSLDQSLENAYQAARLMPTGSPEEDVCLDGIRNLENNRFELLSAIHGNRIQAYRWITT